MNTLEMPETELLGDADLVALCREGDRDAFGQIVHRYQSLVCALAYAACGDIARSEDLAQETFLAAWRQLQSLREPARLRNWLCGIARHLTQNSVRAERRDPLEAALPVEDDWAGMTGPDQNAPSDQAMSKEEQDILWRVLETLPRAYREPLVLFYRGGESTAEVADALEMSEEAVRQRLSRGRAMLNDRVTRLVESGLRRSGPAKAFTAAVLAALPLASAEAGTTAAAGATVKSGTGLLKAAGGSAWVAALVGIVPVLSGLVGLWGHLENTRSRRERRFVAWSCLGLLLWAAALPMAAILVFRAEGLRPGIGLASAVALSLIWLALVAPLDAYVIWSALRQKRIRAQDASLQERPVETARRGFKVSMYGALAAMIFGLSGWLILLAARAEDLPALMFIVVIATAGWLASARTAVRQPARTMQVFIAVWSGLALLTLVLVNLRWPAWTGSAAEGQVGAPPGLNLLIAVFFGSIRAGWFLKQRLLTVPTVRRDSLIALTLYALLMASGFRFFEWAKGVDALEVEVTQIMHNEIQPDGTIRFLSVNEWPNRSAAPLHELSFYSSDFIRIDRMTDSRGEPLSFSTSQAGSHTRYLVTLNSPVPPGSPVLQRSQGTSIGRIRDLGDGWFEYEMRHWPASGVATRRVEVFRLPPGATFGEAHAPNATVRTLPDGRSELRTEKIIPPGGSISVRLQFRYSSS